jgi:flagellar biosynthesis/type III secretory pathway protein FliH
MSRGGVVIETEFGDIDATIKSQIEHLREVLFDHA